MSNQAAAVESLNNVTGLLNKLLEITNNYQLAESSAAVETCNFPKDKMQQLTNALDMVAGKKASIEFTFVI
jgi:hypothetical protein